MKKKRTIIYWSATTLLALGMLSGGIMQIMQRAESKEGVLRLGYPAYFLTIIGTWKILGVVTILLPKMQLLKEWAYAGFFFVLSGAALSQFASGQGLRDILSPIILLTLTLVSWYFRPMSRRARVMPVMAAGALR